MSNALVIGAGPAGLMAAEVLGRAGIDVMVAEAKPSPARKFLMAGKSGLNLTKSEDLSDFLSSYGDDARTLTPLLESFGPTQVQAWAEGLDQQIFTGSTGRVFPKAMKASPLLRAWLARLDGYGVTLRTGWRWQGWEDAKTLFETPDGPVQLTPDVTVLACGGASWARLGSDGTWVRHMADDTTAPFQPANMGLKVAWSDHMKRHFGTPLKGVALTAGNLSTRGEAMISAKGLEGGGIYMLSPALRDGHVLRIDLIPELDAEMIRTRLAKKRGKASLSNHLRKALKLTLAKQALLMEFGRPLPDDLAPLIKALPIPHDGPRPLDEAISTAGGLRFDALDSRLMLRDRPGVFAAGEMLDWEAPTGGYLITACLASGQWAGQGAVDWLRKVGCE